MDNIGGRVDMACLFGIVFLSAFCCCLSSQNTAILTSSVAGFVWLWLFVFLLSIFRFKLSFANSSHML